MSKIANFKAQFFRHPQKLATNNAGLAPYPKASMQIIEKWNKRFFEEGVHCDLEAVAQAQIVRQKFSHFLGCEESELAFTLSTANSISQIAFGLKFKAGDEVIIWDQEYPSNYYPWQVALERAHAKLLVAKSNSDLQTPLENILELITERTKVIAISWVQYQTGAETDLEKLVQITRAKNIWLVVDGIQAIGVKPFNFKKSGIDVLCGGSHKWLCSPLSTGYLVIRNDRIKEIDPIVVGAMTFGTPNDRPRPEQKMRRDALKFEPGAKAFLSLLALEGSLDLMMQTGLENINAEGERLAQLLRGGLEKLDMKVYSTTGTIVTFAPQSKNNLPALLSDIASAFKDHGIASAARGPGLRLSPHAFNLDSEIQKVLDVIASVQNR